ncbi:ultraviolet-B receptor UVR8-like [Hordeum vulgare]|nr:ultraviolet-B receptor UVR8-like [Hordeum vulgare]
MQLSFGVVYAWGRGEHGRLGFGDDKSSHMVPLQVQLLAGEDIVQVSCGGTHSVVLTSDGRIFSYGRGDHGRLGDGRKVTTGHRPYVREQKQAAALVICESSSGARETRENNNMGAVSRPLPQGHCAPSLVHFHRGAASASTGVLRVRAEAGDM